MAEYYVDFNNGNDGNDGLGIGAGNAWKTTNKASTTIGSGDRATLRGGMTEIPGADITFTNDGTANSYAVIQGAYNGVYDPWGDGVVARPIIDFNDAAFQVLLSGDDFWKISGLDIMQSDASIAISVVGSDGVVIDDCISRDIGPTAITKQGLAFTGCSGMLVTNCEFHSNRSRNITVFRTFGVIRNCILNGGAGTTGFGLRLAEGSYVEIADCSFGETTEHTSADISLSIGAIGLCRNTILDSTTQADIEATAVGSVFIIEDDGQVHEALQTVQFTGNTSRSTAVNRSGEGGTPWSILVEPNSDCGSVQALYAYQGFLPQSIRGIPIYLDGTEQTITVKAYATSWAVLPTVSQFVVEIEHFESAGIWAIDTSSDTFSGNDPALWDSFDITLTPGAAGFAYLRVKLLDYEDGTEKVYIDPVPLIDGLRDESLISPTVDGVGVGYEISGGLLVHPGMVGGIRG